jgi:hypothetical protein
MPSSASATRIATADAAARRERRLQRLMSSL